MGGVRNFPALDWATLPGRGDLAVIPALPEWDELSDPRLLRGQRVMIDSKEYDVIGVETFAVPVGTKDHPYRREFGLLVEGRRS